MTHSGTKASDNRGLAGLTAGDTSICAVNQTQLIYRGYEIADLAANASFEEVAFLLLVGHKPNPQELADFDARLKASRTPPRRNRTDSRHRQCHRHPSHVRITHRGVHGGTL